MIANVRYVAAATALALFWTVGFASGAGGHKGGNAVLTPVSEIRWADVPGFPGVQMAVVRGDAGKGAHYQMLKFTGGFSAPLHHHTADHYGTVVAGTLVLGSGGRDVKLPPGSYFSFTGKMAHTTRCEAGADCILAIDARSKWDVVPEKAK